MIDQKFCEFLEYEICKAFDYSGNEEIKGFWCDGVMLSEPIDCYSQKFVNDNRKIKLKAFIGKNGQSEYELILKWGNKALSKYARNLDIKECNINLLDIDIKRNKMEIQLD